MALFGADKTVTGSGKEEKVVSGRTTGEVQALLGKGSEFEGKLTFEGHARIDGRFQGHITTKDTLTIGETAKVTAEIQAGVVVITGTVEGTVRATQLVELHPPARVKGAIETPAMSMEKGAIFEGTTKMENLSQPKAPPAPLVK